MEYLDRVVVLGYLGQIWYFEEWVIRTNCIKRIADTCVLWDGRIHGTSKTPQSEFTSLRQILFQQLDHLLCGGPGLLVPGMTKRGLTK